jgi:hypothetical protein
MPTRCFWPPESSCGKRPIVSRASPTCARAFSTMADVSASPFAMRAIDRPSATHSRTVMRGLSAAEGS